MHPQLLQQVVEELRTTLTGRYLGKIFQLSVVSFAFDFGLRGAFLFVSVEPPSPRMYLIRRRVKDLERQAVALGQFGQVLRDKLSGASVTGVEKEPGDRIVRLRFDSSTLLAQLTGRTADLFLLGEDDLVEASLRTRIEGIYQRPPIRQIPVENDLPEVTSSPSETADAFYSSVEKTKQFEARVAAARSQLLKSIRQKQKLKEHLQQDLDGHGDPDEHKRIGDLLLANLSTATRAGNKITLTDYYADGAPAIEVEIDENVSLQEEAARRFRQYGKAKRAREEIAERMVQIEREIAELERKLSQIETVIAEQDATTSTPKTPKKPPRKQPTIPGVRRYRSSDGYEVLVGRAARDNDNLTFKIAQPNDLWLHAGDYPGSHVVIRNSTRKEIPHRTIIEAAQLAARFSQASEDSKVVIHYTPRKFLSKPKGAAPGLVRLSRFRSITVEPKEGIPRITV
ncbi:MAG TPA: NFACT RNA binding domain-containing protein [Pyrinomonadaceae bacterium]|nr:NFACT RNA binding domain-containing protein [Pyrinomonadaceae bacterium]